MLKRNKTHSLIPFAINVARPSVIPRTAQVGRMKSSTVTVVREFTIDDMVLRAALSIPHTHKPGRPGNWPRDVNEK